MKAMLLHEAKPIAERPLHLAEVATPEPAAGQVRLKVRACGVCHTDLHIVEGELALPRLPLVPGHQIVATVDKSGPGAHRFQVGDQVGVTWLNWACGVCTFCAAGQENLCPKARFTGLQADGGYAQYLVVDENFALPLPGAFSDVAAAPLLCAGIVGYRALRLSQVRPGQKLGLYGFGASAHLVIQVARHWDCSVYVFTRGEEHRRLARELGAAWAGGAEDDCPAALDGSILFAPAGWIVPLALGHLRPGGTLAINAIHMSPIPEMPYHLLYEERVLRSVANVTRQDAQEFLQLAAEIPIQAEVELFPLARANEALQKMKDSQIRASAVLQVE
ncbi:MAG: zinc-dependent alcohol dehydrogenase family protein [Chloroflexi bacterium]|nr:zinc-dependent alcohol dehydrogenase family protein [Chloroflexota bacterium]MCI0577522.1 zinc-dependent alcohol dehydrogenase family protein [Chloroflexota bacterium]MCI0645639.1 zinc-dependent alcohol dehydrogenase family protein [Chloroflexota bacterium]MCI0725551.1 zinc-dependent alcohol dehydrogenase family protein [Chloroflexota bacterium]